MTVSFIPITIVPRKSSSRNDRLVQISPRLFQQLQLGNSKDIKVSLGKKRLDMMVQTVGINDKEILIPENSFQEFSMPIQRHKFHALYHNVDHTLYLGPIIGLLTDYSETETEEPDFRSIHNFCKELHYAIEGIGGFFYVFSYHDFSIQGYYYQDDKWKLSALPLPDVIYNRIHARSVEFTKTFMSLRKKLGHLNIPLFNDRFFSKWEVHEYLNNENQLLPHLPETEIFSIESLADFFERYETVFIKPVHGSQGKGIIKVTREGELYSFQTSIKTKAVSIADKLPFDEVILKIKPLLRKQIYILQQGISLITHESREIDFRVLCHKNKQNLWIVTSVVARIAAENEFVSNISRGAEVLAPLNALEKAMNKRKAMDTLIQMKKLANEIAALICDKATGITGELGIDIGVDQDGKLWLIEVNSKPSKKFENGHMKIRPSAKAIAHFCTKLAFDFAFEKEE